MVAYNAVFIIVLLIFAIWDLVWKISGLVKSARNKQWGWFVCILLFNTLGILPILYIYVFQKDINGKENLSQTIKKVKKLARELPDELPTSIKKKTSKKVVKK